MEPAALGPPLTSSGRWSSVSYDADQQLLVDTSGQTVVDQSTNTPASVFGPVAGPPTAPTTPTVDGEDPPSSEDWINDYAPEEPDQV